MTLHRQTEHAEDSVPKADSVDSTQSDTEDVGAMSQLTFSDTHLPSLPDVIHLLEHLVQSETQSNYYANLYRRRGLKII